MTQLQIINQLPVFRTVEPENKVKVTDQIRFYISQNITAKASWVNAHELCCRKIEDFEAFYNAKLYTHNASAINLMKFVEYLQSKHLTPGYISGTLGKIKSMLTTAALYGCPVDPTYKKASVITEIPETVALTSGEVAIIETLKG